MAAEALAQLVDVPQARGDELVAALRDQKKTILKFVKERIVDESSREIDEAQLIIPKFELRYYQLMSVRDIYAQLNETGRVMFHAPTGTGKTRMAMSVVSRHLREFGPTTVLWAVSGHELVSQAGKAFSDAWKNHGDIRCELRAWHGENPHFVPQDAPEKNIMLIASLEKLAAAVKKHPDMLDLLRMRVSLVVFDEAHRSVAPVSHRLIKEILKEKGARLLGLSATPGRATEDETTKLAEFFNFKKTSIWRPKKRGLIDYLVGEGYLAHANFIRIDLDNIPSNAMAGTDTNTEEFDNETLNRIGQSVERNLKIVEICKNALDAGHRRVLAFTPSVASSHFCAAALKATSNISKDCCEAIDGKTPTSMRDDIIMRYKDTETHPKFVIFNYNVMTTGVDIPSTSALVIGRPTKSVAQYAQMVGRAIRGIKSGGNKEVYIYTVVDSTLPAFRSVAAAFSNWNNYWEKQS